MFDLYIMPDCRMRVTRTEIYPEEALSRFLEESFLEACAGLFSQKNATSLGLNCSLLLLEKRLPLRTLLLPFILK